MFALKLALRGENKSSKKVTFCTSKVNNISYSWICLNSGVNALLGLVLPNGLHLALQLLEHEVFHCMGFNPCANWSNLRAAAVSASYCGLPKPQGPLTGQGKLLPPSPWSQALGSWPPGCPRAGVRDPAGKQHTRRADTSLGQGRLMCYYL